MAIDVLILAICGLVVVICITVCVVLGTGYLLLLAHERYTESEWYDRKQERKRELLGVYRGE